MRVTVSFDRNGDAFLSAFFDCRCDLDRFVQATSEVIRLVTAKHGQILQRRLSEQALFGNVEQNKQDPQEQEREQEEEKEDGVDGDDADDTIQDEHASTPKSDEMTQVNPPSHEQPRNVSAEIQQNQHNAQDDDVEDVSDDEDGNNDHNSSAGGSVPLKTQRTMADIYTHTFTKPTSRFGKSFVSRGQRQVAAARLKVNKVQNPKPPLVLSRPCERMENTSSNEILDFSSQTHRNRGMDKQAEITLFFGSSEGNKSQTFSHPKEDKRVETPVRSFTDKNLVTYSRRDQQSNNSRQGWGFLSGENAPSSAVNRSDPVPTYRTTAQAPPRDSSSYYHKPILQDGGLINLGSTCYMNSVLQCLMSLDFFVKDLAEPACRMDQSGRSMTVSFADLARRRRTAKSPLDPQSARLAFTRAFPSFAGYYQQDAHEFFTKYLDGINDEILEFDRSRLTKAGAPAAAAAAAAAETDLETAMHPELLKTPVYDNFRIELSVCVTCQTCSHRSLHREHENCLSIDISSADGRTQNLREMVKGFFAKEEVEEFRCENCGSKACVKQSRIVKMPRVIVFHIKRFRPSPSGTYMRCSTPVKASLELELDDSLDNEAVPPPLLQGDDEQQAEDEETRQLNWAMRLSLASRYRLVAAVHHSGAMRSGHYVSYLTDSSTQKWRRYSDSTYNIVDYPFISDSSYLLFYVSEGLNSP